MTVQAIRKLNNNRYVITLDNGEQFPLYRGELSSMRIEEGEEIEAFSYEYIMNDILPKRIRLSGLNLLKNRMYTEHQLRDKLVGRYYPDEIIDDAMEYFRDLKVIDDHRYCIDYYHCYSDTRSAKRLFNDLMKKGVNKSVIEEAYSEYSDSEGTVDEEKQILRLMEKRHYDSNSADTAERLKMRNYLYGKGYNMDLIINLT